MEGLNSMLKITYRNEWITGFNVAKEVNTRLGITHPQYCHDPKYTLDVTWQIEPQEALNKSLDISMM